MGFGEQFKEKISRVFFGESVLSEEEQDFYDLCLRDNNLKVAETYFKLCKEIKDKKDERLAYSNKYKLPRIAQELEDLRKSEQRITEAALDEVTSLKERMKTHEQFLKSLDEAISSLEKQKQQFQSDYFE